MKLLIYGAGVIGSLYAAAFAETGYDTTVYARGKKLETLKTRGLLYEKNGKQYKAKVKVIDALQNDDIYDFIFLTVKENQVHMALEELRPNGSPNIVTMVNTLEPYAGWEHLCGEGRIIPAFPGAGGSYEDGVLKADFTPSLIQATTFAEIGGNTSERLKKLAALFKTAGVPYRIVKDMHGWQLCHLALVVPIADAYYKAENPEEVWKEADIMNDTARQIKNNFQKLYRSGVKLSPPKMHLLRLLPAPVLQAIFTQVFKSRFGNLFMYRHSMKAPDEMRSLHSQLYQYLAAIPTNHSQRGMRLICIGDSLTFGNVGYSYIHFFNKKIHAVNKGKNGDTLRGAYGRLKKIIDKPRHGGGTFILGIGTNDILLSYLKSLSLFWFLTMNLRCKIKRCIENDDNFEREYDRLLHLCSEKNKRVIVFGMPFINLKNFPHEKTVRRNAVIKRLAQKYNYSFIDIYDLQKETLLPDKRTYTWKHGFAFRFTDAVIMTLLPFCKDGFAKARGLNASVDGVHFNSASAKILAAEIEKAALR